MQSEVEYLRGKVEHYRQVETMREKWHYLLGKSRPKHGQQVLVALQLESGATAVAAGTYFRQCKCEHFADTKGAHFAGVYAWQRWPDAPVTPERLNEALDKITRRYCPEKV